MLEVDALELDENNDVTEYHLVIRECDNYFEDEKVLATLFSILEVDEEEDEEKFYEMMAVNDEIIESVVNYEIGKENWDVIRYTLNDKLFEIENNKNS